jgi:hypothetical protein
VAITAPAGALLFNLIEDGVQSLISLDRRRTWRIVFGPPGLGTRIGRLGGRTPSR